MLYHHTPVLLKEAIHYLDPKPGGVFIDATLGGGGYSTAIAERVGEKGRVLGVDADGEAVRNFKFKILDFKFKNRIVIVRGNFKGIAQIADEHGLAQVNGIVADLGLSSYELDSSGRGFSFQRDESLDMRFDTSEGKTAAQILSESSEQELVKIFREYGEERFGKKIAQAIINARSKGGIATSGQLVEAIRQALPASIKYKASDSCRRIFQALRIRVNDELESLKQFLPQAFELLAPGGRLAVVSFHSLEDRIVKQSFVELARGCICPLQFPVCVCGKKPMASILTKKPVMASLNEQKANPRSKSAKLRVMEKL